MIGLNDAVRQAARDAQKKIVQSPLKGRVWVEACPGAGKTATLICRHQAVPVPVRQGRALVSFTRKAAGELIERTRALGAPELLEHPHFISTLDTFLWTFLVRPDGRRWSRLEEWSDHRDATAGGFALDDFDVALDDRWQITGCELALARLPRQKRNWIKADANMLRKAESTAAWKLKWLTSEGFLTGRELRWQALRNLHGDRGKDLINAVKARFAELIIDEAQDCSEYDLQILDLLTSTGLPMLMVGDLDQGIHGYRGSDPQRVQQHVQSWTRYDLEHNWRSTSAICAASATLRSSGRAPDTPVGPHSSDTTPVHLIPHEGRLVDPIETFIDQAAHLEIPADQCLILAYSAYDLPQEFVGSAAKPEAQLAGTAWAVAVLRSSRSTSKQRRVAERHLKELVLKYWTTISTDTTVARNARQAGIHEHRLRSLAFALVSRAPDLDLPAPQWCAELLAVLEANPPAAGFQRSKQLHLRCPPAGRSKTARELGKAANTQRVDAALPEFSVIHQVKGAEADAVMVLIPASADTDTTINAWITGTAQPTPAVAEHLRVLYVAATRARRFLAFAVPEHHIRDVAEHLRNAGVPAHVHRRVGALF